MKNNFKTYLNEIKSTPMSRFNLPIPTHEESLQEILKEGDKLLGEEKKLSASAPAKDERTQLESKLASTSSNPYVRAREEILKKMSPAEITTIRNMESGKEPKTQWYDRFVSKIADLGDKYSELN